jgi:hypothetical protein
VGYLGGDPVVCASKFVAGAWAGACANGTAANGTAVRNHIEPWYHWVGFAIWLMCCAASCYALCGRGDHYEVV